MSLLNINSKQQLFVIKAGSGYTSLGFNVARDRTRQYASFLGEMLSEPIPYGTSDAYRLYTEIENRLAKSAVARRLTIYDPNTPPELISILEKARVHKTRIRLFYGDPATGRDWNEENDVEGYLGRTMGPLHCPILLKTNASSGGGIILSACIVKVIATEGRRPLWQHPKYHSLPFTISNTLASSPPHADYPVEVLRAGEVHARFTTRQQAERFLKKIGVS